VTLGSASVVTVPTNPGSDPGSQTGTGVALLLVNAVLIDAEGFAIDGIPVEPIAVIVLARIGVVTIDQLRKSRGYFIVGSFIVAAVVTPPDVISQLALAIPMCILYEVGIVAAQLFIKHTKAPEETPAA